MTNEAFSNDDDLFSYDPSQEPVVDKPDFSASASGKINSDILEDISKRIDGSKDDDILGSFSMKVRFAQSFIESYTYFIQTSHTFFHRAVHQTLDQLTSGRFSMIYMFNHLEHNLLRRLNVKYILENTFLDTGEPSSEDFQTFLKRVGLDLDETFIGCYIQSNIDINNHVINNERSLYMELAERLDLNPHHVIANSNPTLDDLVGSLPTSIDRYHQEMYEAMFASLADSGYTNKLSDLYSEKVRLSQI
jgi:hypothetical protein